MQKPIRSGPDTRTSASQESGGGGGGVALFFLGILGCSLPHAIKHTVLTGLLPAWYKKSQLGLPSKVPRATFKVLEVQLTWRLQNQTLLRVPVTAIASIREPPSRA